MSGPCSGSGVKLETKRLVLRELHKDDWQEVLRYQSDPRYLEFYSWAERTAEDVRDFVAMLVALQHEHPRTKFQLAIMLKQSGELIGNCGVRMNRSDATEADIGYELAPGHWGNGYATEAATAMVEYGFNELGVHRIWSWCIADNVRSVRVLENVGLRMEGRLREKEYFKGRWWDHLVFAILEDEWRAKR